MRVCACRDMSVPLESQFTVKRISFLFWTEKTQTGRYIEPKVIVIKL